MSQLKRIAWPRFLLLVLTLFALSAVWPGTASAASWDDLLKKAEDLAADVVKDVLDDDKEEESDDDQDAAQETSPATTASTAPPPAQTTTAPPPAQTATAPPPAQTATSSPRGGTPTARPLEWRAPTASPAEPVEAPAEAVPEVKPAQERGKDTMTVDGETRSFVVETCITDQSSATTDFVHGTAKDDAGYNLTFRLQTYRSYIHVWRNEPERINFRYDNRERNKEVFRIDGSTVTLDGTFTHSSKTGAKHSIQLSLNCSG